MSADPPQKRQRQSGSFSPASPPYHLAAKTAEPAQTTLHQHPDTPTSPPYMSSTAPSNSHASTASLSSASAQAVTPPSSANMSHSQPPNTNSFPTPASSAGTVSFAFKSEEGDAHMTDDPMDDVAPSATCDVEMGNDGDHRHTGHDRTGTGSSASGGVGSDNRLQSGSAPFYKLSETPYSLSRPHVSQNLLSLYGLDHIAQSVARFNEKGEKINKLRKSYESHVKDFKISGGKSKAEGVEGQLMNLLHFPDEEYYLQRVRGNELETASQRILAKLNGGALKMAPGKLSKEEDNKWKTRIGTDDNAAVKRPALDTLDGAAKKLKQGGQIMQGRNSATSSPAMRPSPGAAKSSAMRPDRAGKKRSYVESSFKGYGEGYADDDGVGESTGGEDNGRGAGAKKKRRKDFAAGSPLGFDERRGNYNVGMVGVRH